jgi:Fic family protein
MDRESVPYKRISDLSADLRQRVSELASMAAAWEKRREELAGYDELEALHARIRRRWAIDTGMIEGLYTVTRGTTELLIDRGLHVDLVSHDSTNLPATELIGFLHDHEEVYDWIFEFVNQDRPLSTSWIKELHQLMTRQQETTEAIDTQGRVIEVPLEKGVWKSQPNNPRRSDGSVHEYCPPEQVASEMERLIAWHLDHVKSGVSPEVSSAWLHHRFTQIHPFQDGNGRVARALASLTLIRGKCFPMSVSPEDKSAYIGALELADDGDLSHLVEFIKAEQQAEFGRALGMAEQVADEQQLFKAAFQKAKDLKGERIAEREDAVELAASVIDAMREYLTERRQEFDAQATREGVEKLQHAHLYTPPSDQSHYYRFQIDSVAEMLGYVPSFDEFKNWVRLTIVDEQTDLAHLLVIDVHGFGRTAKGVMVAVGLIQTIDSSGEENVRGPTRSATAEPFTFGYLDPIDHLLPRAREWTHDAWLSLLMTWQQEL